MNPTLDVKISCGRVYKQSKYVTINSNLIEQTSSDIISSNLFNNQQVDWDAEGWHYCHDSPFGPLTCQYIFVLDALNFCFWPTDNLEYDTLATNIKHVLENNPNSLSGPALAEMTSETLASWFPNHTLPQIEERVLRLKELGEVLTAEFDGLAENLVILANKSAVKLVQLILRYFPGFRDTAVYHGRLVHFYKRAQILVGDLWAAYGKNLNNIQEQSDDRIIARKNIYCFYDMAELTMFADYRVPQILRQLGILSYTPELTQRIDSKQEIQFGSDEEIEIRACTIVAVEMLQQELEKKGMKLLVIEIDWLLWQIGEKRKDEIPPHHRTLTIYY